jgi:hypothetical protein
MEIENTKCPYCGNTVPQAKFVQIQARIRAEEKEKLAEQAKKLALLEANLKREYEQKSKLQVEAEVKRLAEMERKAADQRIKEETSKLLSERDVALQKLKAAQANEVVLKKQMAEEADRALKRAVEAERKAAAEKAKADTQKLQSELDAALQNVKAAETREAALKKQMSVQAEQTLKKELERQRLVLERDRDQRERRLVAEHARKVDSFEKRLGLLQRQLQQKTANELGDGAEIDLYEELRSRFPTDEIVRVPKGQHGADIHHTVYYKGQPCGKIVYDSKNRKDWKEEYATKLRADQTEAMAEHAILATCLFPRGERELCIRNHVIVVNPGRACYIAELLRDGLVDMHVQNLSGKERTSKMAQLYELIGSPQFKQKLAEIDRLTDQLLELDVEETRAHQNLWKKRGLLMKQLKNMTREIDTDIRAIVERSDGAGATKASSPVARSVADNVLRPKPFARN